MAVAVVILVLLGFAAWRDIATRTIPDVISIAILAVGLAARAADGWPAVWTSVLAGTVLFVALVPFHGRGLLGGGDVKLLAALAFGLSPFASYQLVSTVVLFGGVLALVYLALRRLLLLCSRNRPRSLRHYSTMRRVMAIEVWRIRKGAPLPYGLAIAAGASLVIGHQGA